MLALIESPLRVQTLRVPPSTRAVVSWNSTGESGAITIHAHRAGAKVAAALPYAEWSSHGRHSFASRDGDVRIDVDVIRSEVPFDAVTVESTVDLDAVAVSVPDAPNDARDARIGDVAPLDVPAISQYDLAQPGARGWCSAASTAMLLGAHGVTVSLGDAVRGVRDDAYGGTGNWAFNAAFAGSHGLRAAVAYLHGLDHAVAFVRAGLPVAISISWAAGELPGATVEHAEGHLLVVRGADAANVDVNDPARDGVRARYPRDVLDRLFRGHGGVAYLVAPANRAHELVALANGVPAEAPR